MDVARLWSTLSVAVLLSGAGGDRAPSQGVLAGVASGMAPYAAAAADPGAAPAARARAAAALPRFALFGWVSPPNQATTAERIRELAGAGFNVALPAWADSGRLADNLRRFGHAAENGVRCLAWDERFGRLDFSTDAYVALLDSIVADYASEPGFLGYYFTDEPQPGEFASLSRSYSVLGTRDPDHPAWNNLLGMNGFRTRAEWEHYVRSFVKTVGPSVLCVDMYEFLEGRDRGQFVENVAALRAIADEHGLPFWFIVLLVQHGPYRALTPGELRWQVSHLLAYGARGVGYFTYWTPAPDPDWNWQPAVIGYDGVRSTWYDVLAAFNPYVRAAGETLAGLTWLSTEHAGSVPPGAVEFRPDGWVREVEGRAAIGRFAGGSGGRILLVANSDSLAASAPVLTLPGTRQVWKLGSSGDAWSEAAAEPVLGGARVTVTLEAGGFALLRLEPGDARDSTPALALGPNPARGTIRFAVSRAGTGARLEILDPLGRSVWSSGIVSGAAPLEWHGEREGGGVAPPGVYLARVTGPGGAATARFSWLGGR